MADGIMKWLAHRWRMVKSTTLILLLTQRQLYDIGPTQFFCGWPNCFLTGGSLPMHRTPSSVCCLHLPSDGVG